MKIELPESVVVDIPADFAASAYICDVTPQQLVQSMVDLATEGINSPKTWEGHRVREFMDTALLRIIED